MAIQIFISPAATRYSAGQGVQLKYGRPSSSTRRSSSMIIRSGDAAIESVQTPPVLSPGVLPGTPSESPLPQEKMLEIAEKFTKADPKDIDPDLLSEDFTFSGPVVGPIDKATFLKIFSSFDFKGAMPNWEPNVYDVRVDKFEPHRIWFTSRVTGTHVNDFNVFGNVYKPKGGKEVIGCPEVSSMTITKEGKISSLSAGYVVDRRVQQTVNGQGALFGVLEGMGYKFRGTSGVMQIIRTIGAFVTGIFKK